MGSNDHHEVPDPTKLARDILREVSAAQGWTPETEISVLCDFIDWVQDGQPVFDKWPGTDILVEEFERYLKERSA